MADEPGSVPEPVRAWLAEVAASVGLSEQELLARLVSAEGEEGRDGDAVAADVDGRLAELEAAVDDLDADLDRKIDDVRERVVQLKLEGETKADEAHDHPRTAARLDRFGDRIDALSADLDAVADRLAAVDGRTDDGFSNFEDVLEYLVETTDDLHERTSALAEATLDGRKRVGRLAAAEARRAAADELRADAADHGVSTAACENCGEAVTIGLLAAPACPHCGVQFTELEPRRGFFRSSVLHAGQHPALEGEVAGQSTELRSFVSRSERSPPVVDGLDIGAGTADGPDRTATDSGGSGAGSPDDGDAETARGADDTALTAISGIGPAYAERLRGAGVETVGELALADAERLAADAGIDTGRVERMVRRARERAGSG